MSRLVAPSRGVSAAAEGASRRELAGGRRMALEARRQAFLSGDGDLSLARPPLGGRRRTEAPPSERRRPHERVWSASLSALRRARGRHSGRATARTRATRTTTRRTRSSSRRPAARRRAFASTRRRARAAPRPRPASARGRRPLAARRARPSASARAYGAAARRAAARLDARRDARRRRPRRAGTNLDEALEEMRESLHVLRARSATRGEDGTPKRGGDAARSRRRCSARGCGRACRSSASTCARPHCRCRRRRVAAMPALIEREREAAAAARQRATEAVERAAALRRPSSSRRDLAPIGSASTRCRALAHRRAAIETLRRRASRARCCARRSRSR